MQPSARARVWIAGASAVLVCACGRATSGAPSLNETSVIRPTSLIIAGLRHEERGDLDGARAAYREALAAAGRVYGDDHPNTAFAHAALGVWLARFGSADEAQPHLRASRDIDERRGGGFVNIAEPRLPVGAGDAAASALIRVRLRRDLVLCVLDGGYSSARALGLAEAMAESR